MKAKKILIIISIILATIGLVLWLALPALYTTISVTGKVNSTISGFATIFGGNAYFRVNGVSSKAKALELSPILITALVLVVVGILLLIVRLVVKKNILLMVLTSLCFIAAAVFIILTKQFVVTNTFKSSYFDECKLMSPMFACPFLFASAITSSIKGK